MALTNSGLMSIFEWGNPITLLPFGCFFCCLSKWLWVNGTLFPVVHAGYHADDK